MDKAVASVEVDADSEGISSSEIAIAFGLGSDADQDKVMAVVEAVGNDVNPPSDDVGGDAFHAHRYMDFADVAAVGGVSVVDVAVDAEERVIGGEGERGVVSPSLVHLILIQELNQILNQKSTQR